MTVIY